MLFDHLGNPVKSLDMAIESAEAVARATGSTKPVSRRAFLEGMRSKSVQFLGKI